MVMVALSCKYCREKEQVVVKLHQLSTLLVLSLWTHFSSSLPAQGLRTKRQRAHRGNEHQQQRDTGEISTNTVISTLKKRGIQPILVSCGLKKAAAMD